jgi:tetratricopeptide (TPR) repeat protein
MFVQHASMAKATFRLTDANAADVVAVCRALDGLPLAIELAAARIRLLTPRALLARLDNALDLAAPGNLTPSRQKTLRATIAWSYDLLTPIQQGFFRRLGVFAGGADLDAISAVTTDIDHGGDPFEMVTALVDVNLITSMEGEAGEPRIAMLETIRAYARDQLAALAEMDAVRQRHARYYVTLADNLKPSLAGDDYLATRNRFETEHDNFREALEWALPHTDAETPDNGPVTGVRLCLAMYQFWGRSGYFSEARRWFERAIAVSGADESTDLAECLGRASSFCRALGDLDRAHRYARDGLVMARRLGEPSLLPLSLTNLAVLETLRGQPDAARSLYEEAVSLARESGDKANLQRALSEFSLSEASEHNYHRALELTTEALALARESGDRYTMVGGAHNMACVLRFMGRVGEAQQTMEDLIPVALEINDASQLMDIAEDYAAVLAELGNHEGAVRLLGAADAMHERLGAPRDIRQEAEIAEPIATTRAALTPEEWQDAYQAGRSTTVDKALTDD